MARASTRAAISRPCGRRAVAAGVLATAVGLVAMVLLGWPWQQAGSASIAGVGNWSLIPPAQDLGDVLAGRPELSELARAAPALALGVCVLAAGLAAAVGGPSLAVLGLVDLVVATAMVATTEALRAAA